MFKLNPITRLDYPEPDVIRVQDTYYMLTTTMHFYPGGAILKSYDLQHWEIAGYLYDKLESMPQEQMIGEQSNYGRGMEAGCLRYHNGKFYATFFLRGIQKSYLFISENVEGPWERYDMRDAYFDGSLLFDDDGKVYIAHGYGKIWLTELDDDLLGTKKGGLEKLILEDKGDNYLGYKASHFYKINGRYYLFLMQWPKTGNARRRQLVFSTDSLENEFVCKEILNDDNEYHNQGIAQGGVVDSMNGKWYSVLCQDYGAAGRIPVLVPVRFENGEFIFGNNGKMPKSIEISDGRPYYPYEPLIASDDFKYEKNKKGEFQLKKQWQWNHEPDNSLWNILPEGGLSIKTGKISTNLIHARNTLTQRMLWPSSSAEVIVDGSGLNEGDFAGICALQGCYGFVGITKEMNQYYLMVVVRNIQDSPLQDVTPDYLPGTIVDKIKIDNCVVRLRIDADFSDMHDTCEFFYEENGKMLRAGGKHRLVYKLDHFTGCRYGLFVYSTQKTGGEAIFRNFIYH